MFVGSKAKNGVAKSLVSEHHWIHTSELKSGMYISELDVPWEKTTFMFQGFYVNTKKEIASVQCQATYARVKIEKIAKINARSPRWLCANGTKA